MKLLNYLLIGLLQAFRPLLGPACCKFPIGCTQYALTKLKKEPLNKAVWLIIKRLLSCNPFYSSLIFLASTLNNFN